MGRLSLSNAEKSVEDIRSWYEDQKNALRDFRNNIIAGIVAIKFLSTIISLKTGKFIILQTKMSSAIPWEFCITGIGSLIGGIGR